MKGNFIEYVVSDNPNKYPNGGEQGGYYYETVEDVETEEKIVTAGTSAIVVNPSSGKVMKKVTVNPTPSQSKSVTPKESAQTVSPDSGKLLSSVSVGAIQTEEKTVTAGTSVMEVNPSSGKVMKKVTVKPTPTESKSVTPATSELTVTPSEGKHLSQVVVGAVEDVTPEVTAQTPVITQIAENLGVTITTPSGTNKQILQGNNANLQLISEYDPVSPTGIAITTPPIKVEYSVDESLDLTGIVVTGTFDNGVVVDITDDCTFSPANGTILTTDDTTVTVSFSWGGKNYTTTQAITIRLVKIVTWAGGTDEEIVKMVQLADEGKINLSDYWAVGDTRTVQLSAMSATGVGESHPAQEVDLVLMHAGGYELADGSTCNFVVGQKDALAEKGYINSTDTNTGSWDGSARRAWCNSTYKNAIPSTLQPIFKQFKTITAKTYSGSTNQESVDYFALPAEKEIFDARNYSNNTVFNFFFQFDYYKTASNRVKKLGKTGDTGVWWERSPRYNNPTYFCYVYSKGNASANIASNTFGLAPFGCI